MFQHSGIRRVKNMEVLRIEELSKSFGGVRAVSNVSFTIEEGAHVVIIGPNGAGKTTLFNVVNGQFPSSSGSIYFFGNEISALSTHSRAHLGMARAFQIISLMMELTVLDNALISLHGTRPHRFQMLKNIWNYKDIQDRAYETLSMLDLWDRRNQAVKNLAYGEQRRLEIGLGLAVQPKLFLLDEPSAGLTKEESAEVINVIQNMGKGLTVLIVDHDMELVFEVAERIIVLHYGEIIADGDPAQIKTDQRVREIYMGIEEDTL